MRAILLGSKPDRRDPFIDEAAVLPRANMSCMGDPKPRVTPYREERLQLLDNVVAHHGVIIWC
jgi:hypothetical protein